MAKEQLSLEFFKPCTLPSNRMPRKKENVCTVFSDRGVVAFSAQFGNTLKEGYKYLSVMSNPITEDYAFVFTKKEIDNSVGLRFKSDDCSYAVVSSKALCNLLSEKLGVKHGDDLIMGPNVSKNPDVIFRMIENIS